MTTSIPHLRIVVGFCIAALAGYAVFSVYAVVWLQDAALTGDVVGTWKSFATGAFFFWVGSSSGGKGKDTTPPTVQIHQPPGEPVPVKEEAA